MTNTKTVTPFVRQRDLNRTADHLTGQEARDLLEILATEFNVPVPALRWSFRSKKGLAYLQEWTISCGPLTWRGVTNSLLHEFAHLLYYHRNPILAQMRPHGKGFIETLHEVAEAWHGDARKYGWLTEYKTVAAAGPAKKRD